MYLILVRTSELGPDIISCLEKLCTERFLFFMKQSLLTFVTENLLYNEKSHFFPDIFQNLSDRYEKIFY